MTAYNPAAPPTCRRRCAGTCLRRSRALFRRERRGRIASSRCTSVQRTHSSSAIFARRGSRKSPGECQSGSQTSKATAAALRRRSAPCVGLGQRHCPLASTHVCGAWWSRHTISPSRRLVGLSIALPAGPWWRRQAATRVGATCLLACVGARSRLPVAVRGCAPPGGGSLLHSSLAVSLLSLSNPCVISRPAA